MTIPGKTSDEGGRQSRSEAAAFLAWEEYGVRDAAELKARTGATASSRPHVCMHLHMVVNGARPCQTSQRTCVCSISHP